MKTKFIPKTFYGVLTIFALACCKKDPPPDPWEPCMEGPLPCASQQGNDIFGCYIDGEPFVAKTNSIYTFKVNALYDSGTKYVAVEGRRDTNSDQLEKISFSFYANSGIGLYQMSASTAVKVGYVNYAIGEEYYHDTTNFGNVTLTAINTDEEFVSGTFDMTLKNTNNSPDSLMVITNGRFDIRY